MRLSESWMQFIKFGIVGVANTGIGLGSYYLLLWLGCHYLVANIGSWIISVFNAFIGIINMYSIATLYGGEHW